MILIQITIENKAEFVVVNFSCDEVNVETQVENTNMNRNNGY